AVAPPPRRSLRPRVEVRGRVANEGHPERAAPDEQRDQPDGRRDHQGERDHGHDDRARDHQAEHVQPERNRNDETRSHDGPPLVVGAARLHAASQRRPSLLPGPSGTAPSLGCVGGSGAYAEDVAEVRRLVERVSELHTSIGALVPREEGSSFLAAWLISGRILQLAHALVFMVEAGFGAETVVLDRAMLELSIVVTGLHRDPAMVDMWLGDQWVSVRRA